MTHCEMAVPQYADGKILPILVPEFKQNGPLIVMTPLEREPPPRSEDMRKQSRIEAWFSLFRGVLQQSKGLTG
jgi:hypothetical protein